MAIKTIIAAESWENVYKLFENINFTSFDYNSIKSSVIDNLKIYYPENFNDFIESSELVEFIEIFAYVAEMLAYKIDVSSHDNIMTDTQRKSRILKLAKFLSYSPSRNIPLRGLVKISSIKTTEEIYDSQGINLINRTILWNDVNNPNWKEQFFLVINKCIKNSFGNPNKNVIIDDVIFQLYSLDNNTDSFTNNVFRYSVNINSQSIPLEIVCTDVDSNGPFEKPVDGSTLMNILYVDDGLGYESDLNGFMLLTKQGELSKTGFEFSSPIPNRFVTINKDNINDIDVVVNKVDTNGNLIEAWEKVDTLFGQNITFTTNTNRKRYEIESLENDQIKIIFGDGDFSDIPVGNFEVWTRVSSASSVVIQKSRIIDFPLSFNYTSSLGTLENISMTFSLTNTLQNSAESETIEHIRTTAPPSYYSQNRLVNGEDYNTLPLRNQNILKLNSVNRTFAGESQTLTRTDASGSTQNVNVFGDDLHLYLDFSNNINTSADSSRVLIDNSLENILNITGLQNCLGFVKSRHPILQNARIIPRTNFIENANINLFEKTLIQGYLDGHWYGEPDKTVIISSISYADVTSDADSNIYSDVLPRVKYNKNGSLNTSFGYKPANGLQSIAPQATFGLKYKIDPPIVGNGTLGNLVVTQNNIFQTFTIEYKNSTSFYVYGSISGNLGIATIGLPFTSSFISFTIYDDIIDYILGDAFVVCYTAPSVYTLSSYNLNGIWEIVDNISLSDDVFDISTYNNTLPNSNSSWIIKVKRNEDIYGNTTDWTLEYRDFKIICHSDTTNFWFNSDIIIDNSTKKRVRDTLAILKSNLNISGNSAIGTNYNFDAIASKYTKSGDIDYSSLELYPQKLLDLPENIRDENYITNFFDFVNTSSNTTSYVYFQVGETYDTIVESTPTILATFTSGSLTNSNGLYYRRYGRYNIDFLWKHYVASNNIVDPSTSNINDIFMITQGYYNSISDYISGAITNYPAQPTSLELRASYPNLFDIKMLSDTLCIRSGKFKLLFGTKADISLRARFKIIKQISTNLTDEEIKLAVLDIINEYFDITNWNFGDTFYATELIATIHLNMSKDISSIVIVPINTNSTFGSLFTISSGVDEVLQSCASVNDIEIVSNYIPSVIKQRV